MVLTLCWNLVSGRYANVTTIVKSIHGTTNVSRSSTVHGNVGTHFFLPPFTTLRSCNYTTNESSEESRQGNTLHRIQATVLHRVTATELEIHMVDEPHGDLRFLRWRMMVTIHKIADKEAHRRTR